MRTFVVDSSICLKWVFNDEVDSTQALTLLKSYLEGNINLIAPNLWFYEIINGLKNARLKKPSISTQDLETRLVQLMESGPYLMNISDLSGLCLKYSFLFDISAYDSAYITLAHAHGFTFVTADNKLASKIDDPKLAISLKDIKI